jgi:hypothetical protein
MAFKKFGNRSAWPLMALAFNDNFDRKTAETLLLAVVVLLVVGVFIYKSRKQSDQ